jgi:GAF domain-containing protein
MQPAPTPHDEDERQSALDSTGLVNVDRLRALDDIVELAAMICGVPIALVSLIDRDRQFFKASVGLDEEETARDISFCGHAIMGDKPFVIPDAALDERFADNPLVTGPPHIRFYAGVPLRMHDRHAVGTLCVIDTQPRAYDERVRNALERLARIARLHIEDMAARSKGRQP